MNPYVLIFSNSLHAAFMVPLGSESAWFAAKGFGGYNMVLATLAAFTGSLIAMSLNFGIGYYLARVKQVRLNFSETAYMKVAMFFKRWLLWILLIPQMPLMPFSGVFAAFAGLLGVPPRKALLLMITGRVLYYGYYLYRS